MGELFAISKVDQWTRGRREMNKWEADEHKQYNGLKRSKSKLLSSLAGQKQRLWRDINKLKSFVKPVAMNGSNFKNETLFVCLTATITTRNGWNCTNIYIGNRVVSNIKMSCNRLVNIIVPYGTKVFSKSIKINTVSGQCCVHIR